MDVVRLFCCCRFGYGRWCFFCFRWCLSEASVCLAASTRVLFRKATSSAATSLVTSALPTDYGIMVKYEIPAAADVSLGSMAQAPLQDHLLSRVKELPGFSQQKARAEVPFKQSLYKK